MEDSNRTIYSKHIQKKIKLSAGTNVIKSSKKNATEGQFIQAISKEGIVATEDTLIGNKKWKAEFTPISNTINLNEIYNRLNAQDAIISDLKQNISDLKQNISYLTGKDVVLVAAEVLLFLIKEQPKKATGCNLFTNGYHNSIETFLTTQSDIQIIKNISNKYYHNEDLISMKKAFSKLANGVIRKRNNKVVHYHSTKELTENITELQSIFNSNVNLVKKYPEEYFIISNYNLLMSSFGIQL